jgi:hypothetical protein
VERLEGTNFPKGVVTLHLEEIGTIDEISMATMFPWWECNGWCILINVNRIGGSGVNAVGSVWFVFFCLGFYVLQWR